MNNAEHSRTHSKKAVTPVTPVTGTTNPINNNAVHTAGCVTTSGGGTGNTGNKPDTLEGELLPKELDGREKAERFLTLLDEEAATFTFQTFDDNKHRKARKLCRVLNGSLEQHWQELCLLNKAGAGVFVTINETDDTGRKEENIIRARAVFEEQDTPNKAPVNYPIEPHIEVESSPGKYHRYWLADGLNLDEYTGIQASIAERYDGDPSAAGGYNRVMRLPGLLHQKNPAAPHLVHITHEGGGLPYPADTIRATFPPVTEGGTSATTTRKDKPKLGIEHSDTIKALNERGHLISKSSKNGGWDILCPWHEEHTTGTDGTIYYEPHTGGYQGHGFKCQHSHCTNRTADDLLTWLGLKETRTRPADSPAIPERFTLEKNGVHYHGTDKNGEALPPAWICSPLRITAMTRDADGNAWGRLMEFPDQDRHPHRWAMPLDLLAGDGSEYRRALLSQGLEIAPSANARQRLTEYIQTAPIKARARCVTKTGWHNGVFVLADDTLGENGERVLLQSLHEPAAMRTAGTLAEWRDSVAALCAGNSRLTLAVSAAFAAPLLDITGDESGGINYQGQSSTGKTTALAAGVSVWGGPDYLQRWRATTNGLEATATAYNDVLLCLDELAQVEAKEAGAVAYMLANGTGKQRARRDGLAKPKATWRLLFLSAGEIGIAQHMREAGRKARAGQEVRLADIPADAGAGYGLFETLHDCADGAALSDSIKQAAATYYGTPARAYLAALVDMNRDKLRERLRTLRADFTREALPDNADGQARRVCDRFALIAAGGELATGLDITGWQRGEATQAARKCFKAWLDHRGGAGSQEDKTALAQVQAFFELHGESRFSHLESTHTREPRTINRAGFKQHNNGMAEYFVLPEVWRAEVCSGLDARNVARVCVEHGLIKPGNDGRPTCIKRLADIGLTRCYHFIKTGVGT